MNKSLVLTVVGPDRPGLVDSLSHAVAAHEGNWLKSRMTTLAGQFAGLLWVIVPSHRLESLEAALDELQSQGLRIMIQSADEADPQPTRLLDVQLLGHDRPGIVRELARALKRRHINVEELTSESYSAPMTGEPLFAATLQLGLPANTNLEKVQSELDHLAVQLGVDLTCGQLQPAR